VRGQSRFHPIYLTMKNFKMLGLGALGLGALVLGAWATGGEDRGGALFEVTVTNLTRGQPLSPVLVATHDASASVFTPGQPASPELALLAEDGDNSQLRALLDAAPGVFDTNSSAGPIPPGGSATIMVGASGNARLLSLAAMLVNTNDAFLGVDSIELGARGAPAIHGVAFDAGSEFNSESCAYIPGPACGSANSHDPVAAEGYVYVSNGIHGIGDLAPELYDWHNPVARITVRRVASMP
jgi:hypothetical protein